METATSSPPSRRQRLMTAARREVDPHLEALLAEDHRFDLVAAMTLVLLIVFTGSIWYMQVGVLGLAVAAVLHRPLVRYAGFWLAITVVLAVGHASFWYAIDNHKYLITYWTLVLALARLTDDPLRLLAHNARLLIGLAFGFAVLWKSISGDFLDGSFFEASLLQRPRFFGVAEVIGGVSDSSLRENLHRMATLRDAGDPSDPGAAAVMNTGPRIPLMAFLMTWWTLGIEAVVAACFLWPKDRGLSRWRDASLFAFLITTYVLTPVVGFAWVLCAMGAAQCRETRRFRYWPALYTGAFLFVMVSSYLPWSRAKGFFLG